jgi:hypothetical protein
MFELDYAPFEVDGISVAETKRITRDAGSQLDRFRSSFTAYTRPGRERALIVGIDLKKVAGEKLEANLRGGWLAKWEPVETQAGEQGLAIVLGPDVAGTQAEDKLNHLLLVPVPERGVVSYWAGFAWNRAGVVGDAGAWKLYVDQHAQRIRSPIEVRITAR